MTQESSNNGDFKDNTPSNRRQIVIPVIQEQVKVDKQSVETGKVQIRKTVTEELADVNIPVIEESYKVERIPVNKVVDTPPEAVRYEGDTMIIPVLREVVVVQKRYEIVEEVRLTKTKTETEFNQQVRLKKENISIDRTSSGKQENSQY
jgi:uncharacterized protein (TIGR02271 family)